MGVRLKVFAVALTLGAGCAGEVYEDDGQDFALAAAELEVTSCPAATATNAAHVSAGRAYTTSRYVYFRRVTTYYARGTDQNLGTSGTLTTSLYEVTPGVFSTSSATCSTAPTPTPTPTPIPTPTPVPTPTPTPTTASLGCGKDPVTSGSKTVAVNGANRTYVLAVPSGYDKARAYPLIFAYHGLGGSGAQAQLYLGVQRAAQNQAIVVYPDGLNNTWGLTGTAASADLAFFDALVKSTSEALCVDSARIFATGHSMGGFFSNTLGCARGKTLRAIAPVAGGGPFVSCDGGQVAAWLMAASNDTVVAPSSGLRSRDQWLQQNHCSSATVPVGPSACVAYQGCDPGHPVHWCYESTGGHNWPSYGGQAIWSFFSAL